MKKSLLSAAVLMALGNSAFAQLPVSTTPQNRKVVLEEFTGIYCTWCPDGHKRANDLQASKPAGDVILVNIHTGGYAAPGAGAPDFRTAEGAAISNIPGMGITGYPTGSVNRHMFPGKTAFAQSRGDWATMANQILAMPSYVNVALQGSLDIQTRQLTVNVEAYYTGTTTNANNLTVMLLEDNVLGPQVGADVLYPQMIQPDGSYTHNHMLRKVLNQSAMGEALTGTTAGSTISKTYTFTVPQQFVNNPSYLGNLRLVAFVAEGNSEIMTGAYGPVTLTNAANAVAGEFYGNIVAESEVCQGTLKPLVKVFNSGSTAIQSGEITSNVNSGASSTLPFTKTIAPQTFEFVQLPATTFTPVANNTLNLALTQVNGAANPATSNNTVSKSNILLTTRMATEDSVTMTFTQDQYGSESTWKVIEEASGTVVAQGGPYSDLSAAGTVTYVSKFKIQPSKCYMVAVTDAYGDGINSSYGAGGYELSTIAGVIYTSNGKFGKGENRYFKSSANLAVPATASLMSAVELAPNPTSGDAALRITLEKASNIHIEVLDVVGRVVKAVSPKQLSAGEHQITLETAGLNAGIYNVRISSETGSVTQRLSVVK